MLGGKAFRLDGSITIKLIQNVSEFSREQKKGEASHYIIRQIKIMVSKPAIFMNVPSAHELIASEGSLSKYHEHIVRWLASSEKGKKTHLKN